MAKEITWIEVDRLVTDGIIPAVVSYRGEVFVFSHIADRGDDSISCYYTKKPLTPNYGDRLDINELRVVANMYADVTRCGDDHEVFERPEDQS